MGVDADGPSQVRNRTKAARVLGCAGNCSEAEGIYVGDVTQLASLGAAMAGVSQLVILTSSVPLPPEIRGGGGGGGGGGDDHAAAAAAAAAAPSAWRYAPGGSPMEVDWLGNNNLVKAAVAARVRQVTLVSSRGTTRPDSRLDLLGGGHSLFYKLQSEIFLASSGIKHWMIVKPCRLVEPPPAGHGAEEGRRWAIHFCAFLRVHWVAVPEAMRARRVSSASRLVVSHDDEDVGHHNIRYALA
jgi:hypothetical protein